ILRQKVHLQNAQQHHDRSNQGVEKEFDGCIKPIVAAPDSDEEVHRDERDFKKQIEQEQVHRRENAEHHGLEQKEKNVVFLLALGDIFPGRQRRQHTEERSQNNQED